MKHLVAATALAALALSAPALAKPDKEGKGKPAKAERQFDKAFKVKPAKADKPDKAKPLKIDKVLKQQGVTLDRGDRRMVEQRIDRARGVQDRRSEDRRFDDRRIYDSRDRDRDQWVGRDARTYVPVTFLTGCPPGLAKKRNGCLPPGQAKKLYRGDSRYADWFDRVPVRYRDGADGYRYSDGYLYQADGGSITRYLPLLGAALGVGQLFPSGFGAAVPDRYAPLYADRDRYDYRYADNAIFAVDPQSRAIQSVVALVTGDRWAVGQPMPSGYDAYNLPGEYRDRYRDGPDALYRYGDGQVYRVDPTTRLVSAVVALLT